MCVLVVLVRFLSDRVRDFEGKWRPTAKVSISGDKFQCRRKLSVRNGLSLSLSTSANAPPDGDHQLLERTVKRNKRHPKTKEEMRKKNEATGDDGDTGVTR